jgi:hypothetical protein
VRHRQSLNLQNHKIQHSNLPGYVTVSTDGKSATFRGSLFLPPSGSYKPKNKDDTRVHSDFYSEPTKLSQHSNVLSIEVLLHIIVWFGNCKKKKLCEFLISISSSRMYNHYKNNVLQSTGKCYRLTILRQVITDRRNYNIGSNGYSENVQYVTHVA